ncbi:MAG TPA: ABC transporter ATP-binding protein [Gemmataceae bacterium]|jgi:ATP-binding cassette subfamily B protein/subfamily B ATP-binding cassette protein MsbA
MKNFLRALRHALPYRQRLALSILCALCAAAFWACNFSSIYPVLILLQYKQTPHDWLNTKIEENQKVIADYQHQIEVKNAELDERKREQAQNGSSLFLEQRIRDLNGYLSKYESKLSPVRFRLWLFLNGQKFVNKFVPADCFLALTWVIGLVIIGIIIKCFFEFAQESLVGSIVHLSLFDLRNRFYRNAIHLDVDQFGDQGSSELMARFTNDMESLGAGIKTLFGKVVAEPLKALACVVLASYLISWQLTLMFLILVPIAAFILARVGRIMKQATRRLLERMSNIYKILQESFQGIRVVKAFTMEPYERRRFRVATRDYYRRAMLVVNIDALADPMIEILAVAAVGAALMAGAHLVLHQSTHLFGMRMTEQPMDAAELLQLYVWLAAIADPVRKLSSVFTRIQSACAAADRIFDFVDRRPRVKTNSDGPRLRRLGTDRRDAGPTGAIGGTGVSPVLGQPDYIEFRDVCFSYQPGHPILYDIHLGVRAGETVALVGANGSGKSTLLGLIPRFYDPDHGSVFVDGQDLRRVNLRSLRQRVGIVTQDTILFDDTIYNNIAYGSRRARVEDVEKAAQRAFAHEFILAQPKGYQTRIGEIGSKLSGGQRQRLALARVILRDPSILILDEFTSAADTESEALIHRAMKEFMVGRTTFVITHRLHTLEIADRIVVLEKGRIAAVGTHAELKAGCSAYQRLHEAYSHQRLCA